MTRPLLGYVPAAGGGSGSSSDPTKASLITTQGKTANFTAAPWFLYLIDTTTGGVTATLPAANVAGQVVYIKLYAGLNPVTVQRAGSDTIGAAATSAQLTLANEIWELTSSGTGQWNLTGGNKALGALDARYGLSMLTSGEEVFSRLCAAGSTTLASGTLVLSYLTARKSETTANVRVISGGVASASLTLAKIGLYSIAANGDGTLVASTASDTALLGTVGTTYTRAWATPYLKLTGQRYAIAYLTVGTTAGSLTSLNPNNFANELAAAPRLTGRLFSQTDLPASFTEAGLSTTSSLPYGVILP